MEDDTKSEQISDSFLCAVCLDLLCKPIVLACGHVSCFWCVHKSMSSVHESHCPQCRQAYHHFPAICQMLHFLLKKMYPVSYNKRENQTLEDEKKWLYFSPNLDSLVANEEFNPLGDLGQSSNRNSEDYLPVHPSTEKGEPCANPKQLELTSSDENDKNNHIESSKGGFGISIPIANDKNLHQRSFAGPCEQISVADVLCAACKRLLFQPVVLNCGHVYCEACLITPTDGTLRCQVCQCRHPSGCPKVCLELHHFLEEQFSLEYVLRRSSTQPQEIHLQNGNPTKKANTHDRGFSFPTRENFIQWMADHGPKYHAGVGCDSCGMIPIIGDRYRCKDCTSKSGFDLCGDCYDTRSKVPGRFNQQHIPEHKLELSNPVLEPHSILRLSVGQLTYLSASLNQANVDIGSLENVFPSHADEEDGLDSPITLADRIEDESDDTNQSPM